VGAIGEGIGSGINFSLLGLFVGLIIELRRLEGLGYDISMTIKINPSVSLSMVSDRWVALY
jgi:hypothetical protein